MHSGHILQCCPFWVTWSTCHNDHISIQKIWDRETWDRQRDTRPMLRAVMWPVLKTIERIRVVCDFISWLQGLRRQARACATTSSPAWIFRLFMQMSAPSTTASRRSSALHTSSSVSQNSASRSVNSTVPWQHTRHCAVCAVTASSRLWQWHLCQLSLASLRGCLIEYQLRLG